MPHGPRYFRCSAVISSGLVAVEFLRRVMTVWTSCGEKGLISGSILWVLWIVRMIFLAFGEEVPPCALSPTLKYCIFTCLDLSTSVMGNFFKLKKKSATNALKQ